MEIIFAIVGILLVVYGSVIKFKKNISIIPAMNEERLKKIKKVDAVANDFANKIYLLAVAVFVFVLAGRYFGKIGSVVGLIVLIVAAVSWNSTCNSIDEKIKQKKY